MASGLPGLAGDVQDPVRPVCDAARQHRLGANEDAAEVDLDGAPPVVSADLPSVPERPLILALLTSSRIGPSCPRITVIAVTCQTVSASSSFDRAIRPAVAPAPARTARVVGRFSARGRLTRLVVLASSTAAAIPAAGELAWTSRRRKDLAGWRFGYAGDELDTANFLVWCHPARDVAMNSPPVSLAQDRQHPAPPTIPVLKAAAFRAVLSRNWGMPL